MAKLVDAHDSGSCGEILGGSNPPIDTIFCQAMLDLLLQKPLQEQ